MVLAAQGVRVSKKLVSKLMRKAGLVSKVRQRKKSVAYRGQCHHVADNTLDRKFETVAPNLKWVSDITEFHVAGSKVYFSPVMDLFDHKVIAHSIATSPSTDMATASLSAAFAIHTPSKGLLVHTDQGFHYRHQSWRNVLKEHGTIQSMSRKGTCYDSAVVENLFGHIKAEMYHGENYVSVEDFTSELEDYIIWYNNERVQERLEGMSPNQYRAHTLQNTSQHQTIQLLGDSSVCVYLRDTVLPFGYLRDATPEKTLVFAVLLVLKGGVEPPRPFGHTDLNRARLPIPPLEQ